MKRALKKFTAIFLSAAMTATALCSVDTGAELFPTENYTGTNKNYHNYLYHSYMHYTWSNGSGEHEADVPYDQRTDWSSPVTSYLTPMEEGVMRFQSSLMEKDYLVEYYSEDFKFLKNMIIPAELPLFGGFYATADNYYILTGQENPEESDEVEVYRITKYDKNWKRLGSAGLYGANTTVPFAYGSARMADDDGYLYIRTCHEMYTSDDGLNHQANVTIQVDIEKMKIYYAGYLVSEDSVGYVSHSFNQFIKFDKDGTFATVDHGDAYPREVSLNVFSLGENKTDPDHLGSYTNSKEIILNDSLNRTQINISMSDLLGELDVNYLEAVTFYAGDHDIILDYNAINPVFDVDENNPYRNRIVIPAYSEETIKGISFITDEEAQNKYSVTIEISADDGADHTAGWLVYSKKLIEGSKKIFRYMHHPMVIISGNTGDSYTGIEVGGFEISDTSYIAVGVGNWVSPAESSMHNDKNNIFVSVTYKGVIEGNTGLTRHITFYTDGEGKVSNPFLTKISDNSFLLIWEKDGVIYYTQLDGNGEQVSEIYNFKGALSDCEPVVMNGEVVWYVWENYNEYEWAGLDGYVPVPVRSLTYYTINTTDISKTNTYKFGSILGDVNNDGEVGELDSVELARYLANWNVTIDEDAADLDGDGEVGETDSVILARRLAGWNV